jgi:tRNA dimethylallyltransferase
MQPSLLRAVDVFLEEGQKSLIVILGPTASGKSALSIEIAEHADGEIVNADSRQLYRGLDIGTAKINGGERRRIPHHLIDVLDPCEEVTVGWYQEQAAGFIDDILARGKVPILVGGSMLYVASITDGLTLAPSADSTLHERLMEAYDRDGGAALYKRLQSIDPDAAAAIHQNNKPRVVRAVEIYEVLKSPKSKVMTARGELRPGTREGTLNAQRGIYNLLILGVDRSPDELKKRIDERTEVMLKNGWIDEVRTLLSQGYTENDPGMKSHGYRQIIQYLRELESGDADPEEMKENLAWQIAAKTRQYAKRQLSWWRGDKRIRWVRA